MDGMMYTVSLVLVALLAFTFFQNNSTKLMLLVLAVGIYIIYSHETGHTATAFKNEMIESIDKSASKFSKSHGTEGFDAKKAEDLVKNKKE